VPGPPPLPFAALPVFWLIGSQLVVAALVLAAGRRRPRSAVIVSAGALAAAFGWLAAQVGTITSGGVVVEHLTWVPHLGVSLDLRLDGLALIMGMVVTGAGALITLYSGAYFKWGPPTARFVGYLTAFAASMLGIVVSDNLYGLFVFWELTTITSYLLIGFEDEKGSARAAALQALLVTGVGGLAMLGGLVLLAQQAGTSSLAALLADPPGGTVTTVALLLVLAGAFTKSAQVPFHFWLPGAMAAPTPASAYLHSATMVKAGVFLLARISPAFHTIPFWTPLVVGIGLTTMILGAWRALRQHDLKLLLAYGTVSQLGLLTALFGMGTPAAVYAGVAMLLAHALFKAPLFLVVGAIDKQTHCRDIRLLDGLARRMPGALAVALAAGLSMAGVLPLFGFVAKEAAFEALLARSPWLLALVAASSALTVAYTARALWGAFGRKPVSAQADLVGAKAGGTPLFLLLPAALPAALGLAFGLLPGLAAPLLEATVGTAGAGALKLWPGLKPALGVSAATLLAGLLLFARRDAVERLQRAGHRRLLAKWAPTGEGIYRRALAGLNRSADRVTAVVQSGSLPVYLGIILLTVILLPGSALVLGTALPRVDFGGHWAQFLTGGVVAAAALAILRVRRRMAAVVLLGAVGYGMAGLFIVYGAPDLALTQLLIETLGIVIFALVLFRLPPYFREARWRLGRALRLGVSAAVGLFVTGAALAVGTASRPPPVSAYFNENALSAGGGRNVVNVILTDFRALDTLGEITVVATAAIGIAGLVTGAVRSRRKRQEP